MRNFGRALREALQYWWMLGLGFLCSLAVAALWSANISALFPILEVTLRGKSLQVWIVDRIEESQAAIVELNDEIDTLQTKIRDVNNPVRRREIAFQMASLRSQLDVEEKSAASNRRLKPYIDRWMPAAPFATVILIVVCVLVSTFVKHVFLLGNSLLVGVVSHHIARDTRARIFNHALAMDQGGISSIGSAGFMAQITHTTEMLGHGISNLFAGAVREPLKIVSCLTVAGCISWGLLLLSVLIAPVVCVLILLINRAIRGVSGRLLSQAAGMNHVILEALNCIRTVQATGMEHVERQRFAYSAKQMFQNSIRINFFNSLTRPVSELLGVGMVATAVVAGSYLVLQQETHIWGMQVVDKPMSVSVMLVFFGLLVGASDPVRKLSGIFVGINSGMVAADRLYGLLDRQSLIQDPDQPKSVGHPHRSIEFRDLSFSYIGDEYVLRDLNLRIGSGEKVAVVGANGCGKSTLVNLLCRFYDPKSGAVMMDGVDLRDMKLDDLRGRISLVTQRTELFNEPVMYNIRYGAPHATDDEVFEAARKAYAHDFITQLPNGYDTVVGENGNQLSGGQRQRIVLARALLRNPEVLILDEATSQIDVESEQCILQSLVNYSDGRTLILITHRRAMLALADRVIEIREGRAVAGPRPAPATRDAA